MGKFLANLHGKIGYAMHLFRVEDTAFAHYAKAFEMGCTHADPMAAYGLLLMRRQSYDKALEVLRYAKKLKLKPQQWGIIYQNLGLAYWKMGQIERAVSIYKQIFERVSTVTVYGTLGFLLIAQGDITGDYQEALEFNQKACEYDEEDPVILDNMGQALYRTGEIEQAESYFVRALKVKPGQFDTLVFMAKIHMDREERESAREMLNIALNKRYSIFNTVPRETALEMMAELGVDCTPYVEEE